MHFTNAIVAAALVGSAAAGATFDVQVGWNGTGPALTFSPTTVAAAPGDIINFSFPAGNQYVRTPIFSFRLGH
jgi:plastocyanin